MKAMITAALMIASAGATAASANTFTASPFGPSLGVTPDLAIGAQANVGNAVFNTGGGAVINEADPHTIGGSDPFANAFSRPSTVSSAVSTDAGIRTVTISWSTDEGAAMLQPGDQLAGAPITQLSFELGTANFPNGGILDNQFAGFNHAEDAQNPGTFLADFDLLDADGDVIFSGQWFVSLDATGISGRTFIGAGGADLANFNIGGGTATVSYFIPTPGALALFGIAGFAASRRRR